MHSAFDEMPDRWSGVLSSHNELSYGVHEHLRNGAVTQPCAQIEVKLTTLNHSRYLDLNKTVED